MQTFNVQNGVSLFGVHASSFPDGVQGAWEELHKKIGSTNGRSFYGISHGSRDGSLVYKACVEEAFEGEANALDCEKFLLPAGEYNGKIIHDFMQQISTIGETFKALLARNDYDPNGVCVEHYLNESDVICMLKRKSNK